MFQYEERTTGRPGIPKRARGDGKQRQEKQVARSTGIQSDQITSARSPESFQVSSKRGIFLKLLVVRVDEM